jgi:hypothetical protein
MVKIETGFVVEMKGPNMMLSWNGSHTWVGDCVEGETMVGQFDHNRSIFLESKLDTSDVLCKIDKFTMHINIC